MDPNDCAVEIVMDDAGRYAWELWLTTPGDVRQLAKGAGRWKTYDEAFAEYDEFAVAVAALNEGGRRS